MSNFLTFLIISLILVIIILFATYFINIPTNDYEKHSAYECGFEPFGDARSFFDIHFYTIGLLFIIFDLEIVFLIPAVVDIANISLLGYTNLLIFLLVVLIGFYYEWAIGLLNWLPQKLESTMVKDIKNQSVFFISFGMQELWQLTINTNLVFIILCSLIVISLILNQLNNLIYRVINLAGLSLITVGTWIYFTELTFLYIVYILAFVGAVIMLFLSVILMLPSSLTNNNLKMSFPFFIIVSELNTTLPIENSVFFCLILIIFGGFMLYYFKLFLGGDNIKFFFDSTQIYFNSKKLQYKQSGNKALFILGEIKLYFIFVKDYLGVGIPSAVLGAYTKNPLNFPVMPRQLIIIIFLHDLLYYIYINIEARLYNNNIREMYKNTDPVWGKFFMLFEYGYAPARSIKFLNFPLRDILKPYIPFRPRWSLFNILPYTHALPLIKYVKNNSLIVKYMNRMIFFINLIYFFLTNIIFNIILWFYVNEVSIDLLKQLVLCIGVFSSVVPSSFQSLIKLCNLVPSPLIHLDSLLAIKHILYENNILFLLVSVVGLLVALIGSAVFTRSSK